VATLARRRITLVALVGATALLALVGLVLSAVVFFGGVDENSRRADAGHTHGGEKHP
jgi:hypothetical protein